jgi:hypothetical protein
MSHQTEVLSDVGFSKKLVYANNGSRPESVKSYYVLVSHEEMDTLVGRLMQMCDLIGDVAQRKALKDTIKRTNREWLDSLYEESGYDRWTGVSKSAQVIEE